jgi:hypothetical protein
MRAPFRFRAVFGASCLLASLLACLVLAGFDSRPEAPSRPAPQSSSAPSAAFARRVLELIEDQTAAHPDWGRRVLVTELASLLDEGRLLSLHETPAASGPAGAKLPPEDARRLARLTQDLDDDPELALLLEPLFRERGLMRGETLAFTLETWMRPSR